MQFEGLHSTRHWDAAGYEQRVPVDGHNAEACVRAYKRPKQSEDYETSFRGRDDAVLVVDNGSYHCRVG